MSGIESHNTDQVQNFKEASNPRLFEHQRTPPELAQEVSDKALPKALEKLNSTPLRADIKGKLKNEIQQFVLKAALSNLNGSLSRFNSGDFDIDGKEGLNELEFKKFESTLNSAIENIISLRDIDTFSDVQQDIAEDIDTWSAKNQIGRITKGRTVTDWLHDSVSSDAEMTQADREKMFGAKYQGMAGGEEFWKGVAYSIAHEVPQMGEDIVMLLAGAPTLPGSLPQYLYYRGRVNLAGQDSPTEKEYSMKVNALSEANPLLGLLNLLTSEKGWEAGKQIFDKLGSPNEWTAHGVVLSIVAILGMVAGGAGALRLARAGKSVGREATILGRAGSAERVAADIEKIQGVQVSILRSDGTRTVANIVNRVPGNTENVLVTWVEDGKIFTKEVPMRDVEKIAHTSKGAPVVKESISDKIASGVDKISEKWDSMKWQMLNDSYKKGDPISIPMHDGSKVMGHVVDKVPGNPENLVVMWEEGGRMLTKEVSLKDAR